jgi:DNA-binding CsgD family transcriptional regulator
LSVPQAIAYARHAVEGTIPAWSDWSGLTMAERKVAALAAAGLSNPRIAERLSLSRNTVENHLQRIFAKLEIASRTQLAKIAGDSLNQQR